MRTKNKFIFLCVILIAALLPWIPTMISSSITAYLIMGFFMIHGSMVIIGITRLVNLVDDPDHLFDQLFVYGGENRQEKLTKFELISCCFIVYWFVIPWSLATPSDKIF